MTHLVVDKAGEGKKAFARAGLSYTKAEVIHVELPNMPGTLAKFAGKLAKKGINITSGYATSRKASKNTSVVLAVSDLDKAAGIKF